VRLQIDAVIARAKLVDYLLKSLPQNDKSQFLAKAGYTQENWQQLERDLRMQILRLDAVFLENTRFGDRYEIRGTLTGVNGVVLPVVTIWMVESASQETKFITLFPNKSKS
jgi:hypothetical protein